MIRDGKAYSDNTPAELMSEQREAGIESEARNNTVEQSLALFEGML